MHVCPGLCLSKEGLHRLQVRKAGAKLAGRITYCSVRHGPRGWFDVGAGWVLGLRFRFFFLSFFLGWGWRDCGVRVWPLSWLVRSGQIGREDEVICFFSCSCYFDTLARQPLLFMSSALAGEFKLPLDLLFPGTCFASDGQILQQNVHDQASFDWMEIDIF